MDTAGPPQDKGAHKGLRLLAERLDLEEKLKAVDEQGRSWLADHPMTILSLVFSGLFIFAAQPIAATFTDLPSAALLGALGWDSGIARSLGLWLFIVMLGGGWLGAHMVTVVHRAEFGPQPQRKPNPIVYVQKRVQGLLMAVFVHPVGRFSQRQRRIAGVMAIALSSAIWLWVGLQVRDTPGAGASEAIGWLALLWLTGVWLVFSSYDSMRLPGVWTGVAGAGIVMVGASGLFGAVLYQLVESPSTVLTWRLYTLWSVVHITIIASVLGHACDAAGSTLGVRLAYGAGVVGAVLVAVALPIDIGHAVIHPHPDHPGAPVVSTVLQATSPEQEATQAEALDDAWFDAVEHRLAQIPAGEPVVIVAASGGGSRAALYATLTLEALERTPPHGTVEQWTEREAGPSIADQVLFITSVSGGSVAASHFRFAAEPDPVVHSPHNTVPGELAFHFGHEVQRLCARQKAACTTEAAELGHQEGRGCTIYGRLCQTPDDPDAVPKADQGFDLAAFREHPSDPPWPLGSARFDAIATDFNAPLLRGMVLPGMERGESMTLFWRTHFGWQDGYDAWRAAGSPPEGPLLLINLTDVMRGTRLVAGFPQLPPGLIGIRADAPTGDEAARFSVADAASLTDIDPFLTVDVEEAVRMSANFPWGFDLPTVGIEGRGRAVRVVDGGVLDNTGIDTIYQLLLGLERISDERQSAGLRPSLRTRATALMDELASRGVVLLEIDSGAKPEQPGMVTKALSNVLLPVHSLSMSGFVRASETTSSYIEVMEQLLTRHAARRLRAARPDSEREDRLPDGALVGRRFDHVVYVLNTEGLMTSWGLAPTQKGELVARFLAEDASQRLALRDAIEAIEGANQAACLLARTRAGGPVLTRLFTGIYDEWDDLGRLERATMDDEDEQRRQTYDVALGDADPKGGIPPNTRPLRGWYPIGLFQPQFAPAPVGETDADTTGTPSLVPSTQCGGTPGHLGPGHWLLSRVDAARDLAPGDLVGHRFELLRPALLREAPPDSEGRLGKEIAGGIYPRGSSFEVLSVQQFGSTGIWFAEAAFGRAAATHTP